MFMTDTRHSFRFLVYPNHNPPTLGVKENIMGADLALAATDFEANVLKSDVPVLVDFWATWCPPCVAISPHIEAIAGEVDGQAKVYKVDVDANGDLASDYGIMSIPALLVFKDGKVVDRMGFGSKDQIKNFLLQHAK